MEDITSAQWANQAQQELVDFVKQNIAPGRVFVLSLARRLGNTTVLDKLRREAPELGGFFDREDNIDDAAWGDGTGSFVVVRLEVSEFLTSGLLKNVEHVKTFKSPTAKAHTTFHYRVFVFQMKEL